MDESLAASKRRIAINSLFSTAAWFVPLAVGFISTPVLVNGLGTSEYGLYALIAGFISYSFSFSIGRIVVRYVAEYSFSQDISAINQIISSALIIAATVGVLGGAVLAIMTPYIVSDVLRIDAEHHQLATYAFYIANATIIFTIISQVFQYTLQGFQRFGRYVFLTNLYSVFFGFGNIVLVKTGVGLVGLQLWGLILIILLLLGNLAAVKTVFPAFRLTFSIDSALMRSAIRYAVSIIFYQVFGNLLFIFERVWVTRHFGPSTTAHFAISAQIGIYVQTLAASLAAVFLPVMSQSIRQASVLNAVYRRVTKILLGGLLFFLTFVFFLGDRLLAVWIGNEFAAAAYNLLVIQTLSYSLISLMVVVWQLNEAAKAPGLNTLTSAVWLAASVVAIVSLTDRFGAEAVAIGRLIGVALTLPAIFLSEKRFLGAFSYSYWLGLILRLGIPLVAVSLLFNFLSPYAISFMHLAFAGLLGLVVYSILAILCGYFSRSELSDLLVFRKISGKRGVV